MYTIIWEYQVQPNMRRKFESIYSVNGRWVELFKQSAGYSGTELLRDEINSQRYITIDRWESKDAYEVFLSEHEKEYHTLDTQCEGLTEHESLIGKWETT